MSRRRDKASPSMAAAAMSLVQLERWLQDRVERRPVATSLPVLDGYIAAIVAGPVSISPLDWICPLLAIDADAFNHGGTPEFAAISRRPSRPCVSIGCRSATPALANNCLRGCSCRLRNNEHMWEAELRRLEGELRSAQGASLADVESCFE